VINAQRSAGNGVFESVELYQTSFFCDVGSRQISCLAQSTLRGLKESALTCIPDKIVAIFLLSSEILISIIRLKSGEAASENGKCYASSISGIITDYLN
jgi:hypothetical protein